MFVRNYATKWGQRWLETDKRIKTKFTSNVNLRTTNKYLEPPHRQKKTRGKTAEETVDTRPPCKQNKTEAVCTYKAPISRNVSSLRSTVSQELTCNKRKQNVRTGGQIL